MKALTICQPYAHLIGVTGRKGVENRTRRISHRGSLLVHAGKSRTWLRPGDLQRFPDMSFGALVGIVDVVACYRIEEVIAGRVQDEHRWIIRHPYTEGPFCIVMVNPRRFATPIAYVGQRGLFSVDDAIIAQAKEIPTAIHYRHS